MPFRSYAPYKRESYIQLIIGQPCATLRHIQPREAAAWPVKRVALYARVSTDGQSVENQLRELESVAVKEGWTVVERFVDQASPGRRVEMADQRSTGCARAWSGVTSIWWQPGPSIGLAVAFRTWCPS